MTTNENLCGCAVTPVILPIEVPIDNPAKSKSKVPTPVIT